jgi:hypothetical protein
MSKLAELYATMTPEQVKAYKFMGEVGDARAPLVYEAGETTSLSSKSPALRQTILPAALLNLKKEERDQLLKQGVENAINAPKKIFPAIELQQQNESMIKKMNLLKNLYPELEV